MLRKNLVFGFIATALFVGASTAAQARIPDAAGDFLGTYIGAQGGDLDVLEAEVLFDGTDFTLTTTLAGAVGTTPNGFYVWGFDRGGATLNPAPFASIGIDNVFFNSVVILRPDTTVTVNRIGGGGTTNFGAGTAIITGNTISARIAATELPSTGFAPGSYTWNLWPRLAGGTATNISDFAPNNSNAAVVAVPEANSALLFAPAFLAGLGLVVIRRRNTKVA
ncbi:MAG: hypothetical protein H8F28_04010 [Fibrella sp.]|nr:hypothetical protein [Armatimonadota bacterium]